MIKRLRNLDRVDEWRDKEKLQNGPSKLSYLLTYLQGRRDELHRDMMRLPRGDERRVAWLAVDRLSSQWVCGCPRIR